MVHDKSVLMLGCFDTKGEDFGFLYQCLLAEGKAVLTMNTGVMETNVDFPINVSSEEVAAAAGASLNELRVKRDRGHAVKMMGLGAATLIGKMLEKNQVGAAIGMGGGGGTFIALTAMQQIPLGIPKLCLSTLAGKDVSKRLGSKDITLMPSIVDVAGLNSISSLLIRQAAAAISAMANVTQTEEKKYRGRIAISMFGNTTACVNRCSELLRNAGYEVFSFHANGVGGTAMESLIRERCFDAVLDVTTTELADDLCGGVCSAGAARLLAAAETGIPQVVVPGCLDMVNFAQLETVPDKYKDRDLYSWSPDVTLMRTNDEENKLLGEQLAAKINRSTAPASVFIPLQGISQIDAAGQVFYRPQADSALFNAIKQHASETVRVTEIDAHINDAAFSHALVSEILQMIQVNN
jgi:uncharacterized protein (UPF0261 family)